MRLPKNVQKDKEKKKVKLPSEVGGAALERLHQFELERGLPETELEKPKSEDAEKTEECESD